jgi:hypothetical protein
MGFVVDEVTLGRENMCYSLRTQERLTNNSRGLLCNSLRTGYGALAYTKLHDLKTNVLSRILLAVSLAASNWGKVGHHVLPLAVVDW